MERVLIWTLGTLLVCAVAAIAVIGVRVLAPLKKLKDLTERIPSLDKAELKREAAAIPGAPGAAARAVADCVAGTEGFEPAGDEGSAAEERYRTRIVDSICGSLLPQPLKNNDANMTFSLSGRMLQGKRRECAFYDYFYLDGSTLCFTVGRVPGSGIAEALFSVVAQTTIRSRLRMGRSLIETMSDVNNQLFDLGGKNSVYALVCVLNIVNGHFSFVNAGGSLPLLMRSEERYEWLRTPVYAPLGANESVNYRSEVLRLNQGDRLFLFTADLGEIRNREGERFADKAILTVLNRSRSMTRGTEELLSFVHDEASAFCESGDEVLSSAAIALEYKKGNREFIFTTVRGTPDDAPAVTEFVRKTLTDGGVPQKDCAMQILLADELFALCCRSCTGEAKVKVECAILSEENTFHIRMFAPMGGRDPLKNPDDAACVNAVNYIHSHTKRMAFESGIDRDMLEVISELSRGE